MDIHACQVVLASGSPRRREILTNAGVHYVIKVAQGEEHCEANTPREVVRQLSYNKATEVAHSCEQNALVIGADTVVAYQGEILGKPVDAADAVRMIQMLQGNTHSVFTGVTLVYKGEYGDTIHSFEVETKVKVYPMEPEEIEAYVATKEPMDKAGAYGIQGYFAQYVEGIKGDYLNVVGLPLSRLLHEIKRMEIL